MRPKLLRPRWSLPRLLAPLAALAAVIASLLTTPDPALSQVPAGLAGRTSASTPNTITLQPWASVFLRGASPDLQLTPYFLDVRHGEQVDPAVRAIAGLDLSLDLGRYVTVVARGFYDTEATNNLLARTDELGSVGARAELAEGYISVGGRRGAITVGRQRFGWGPSPHGGLNLSGMGPGMDMVRSQVNFWGHSLQSFLARLSGRDGMTRVMYGHRLTLNLGESLTIGLTDMTLTSQEEFELSWPFMVPIVLPNAFAEWKGLPGVPSGENANSQSGFDIEWRPGPRLYGHFAADNGFSDRVTFHKMLSTEVELPEPAGVVVSDLRSVLPLFEHHMAAVADARERLLAPGGVLIPRADTVRVAVAQAPELFGRVAEPWVRNELELDLSAGRQGAVNRWRKVNAKAEHLLSQPAEWARLDYRTVADPDVRGQADWTLEGAGTGHGFLVWFDAELADGIGFSNAPGGPDLIYGQAFFPWEEEVPLEAGDRVELDLRADLVGDDYVWKWETRVVGRGGDGAVAGASGTPAPVKAHFRQSTFLGESISAASLRKRAANFVPELSDDGSMDRFILERMDGRRSLEAIAREVADAFPREFRDWQDALGRVGKLSEKHAR